MSIQDAVGVTYTGLQITTGSVTDEGSSTFYQASSVDPTDSLVITSVNGDTVGFAYIGANPMAGFGTVIANDADSFIFSFINGTKVTNFYVRNAPQFSDPSIDIADLPDEYIAGPYGAPPCYCTGTLIRTDRGDVAVEHLAVGDRVVTTSGVVKAVRWMGTRSYAGRFLAAHPEFRPVRFRAGSLGTDGTGRPVPSRDLLVSPKHAMLIDGVLVPAELLVNGRTVVPDGRSGDVSYWHVELPDHDAIWAENAPSETFVDDGSRAMFHNARSFAAMYPEEVRAAPVFCAPRVESGEALDAIRRRLNGTEFDLRAAA